MTLLMTPPTGVTLPDSAELCTMEPRALYVDTGCPCRPLGWWGGMLACKLPPFKSVSIVNISSSLWAYSLAAYTMTLNETIWYDVTTRARTTQMSLHF
jgi:hypothetical protein